MSRMTHAAPPTAPLVFQKNYRKKNHLAHFTALCGGFLWASIALNAAQAAPPKMPFVIAPMIEGQGYCDAGSAEPSAGAAIAHCASHHNFGTQEFASALDRLEPHGAKGSVQIGYTIGINLLENPDSGEFNPFGFLTNALKLIDRPAVIYIFANHFAGITAKPAIAEDSMARFADQSTPSETYFQRKISPITLSTDATLSVNQQRNKALKKLGDWYKSLPDKSKNKIIAFTMAGELHHFYDDFSTGMGRFENIHITDYSPSRIADFQGWLENHYGSIKKLNDKINSEFKYFNEINPPSKNIQSDRLAHFSQHFDSFAHGQVPIEGWLEKLPPQHQIKVYLNGVALGKAEYGLNRQDVYESAVKFKTAQLGFRYLLDFSKLPRGKYTVQVMLEGPQRCELARRSLSIMGQSQEPIPNFDNTLIIQKLEKLEKLAKSAKLVKSTKSNLLSTSKKCQSRFYLDRPANELALFYNPLAKDWLQFRSEQVTRAYEHWFDASKAIGLPPEKLFSHQIAVATVGGWNPVLFASDASLQGEKRYQKGINLYGGSASMALLKKHYLKPGEVFGVPEFHSQAWKDAKVPGKVLQELQAGGARFVSPYFLSMVPNKYRDKPNDHDKFRLSPDNKNYGSDHLYFAIKNRAKK